MPISVIALRPNDIKKKFHNGDEICMSLIFSSNINFGLVLSTEKANKFTHTVEKSHRLTFSGFFLVSFTFGADFLYQIAYKICCKIMSTFEFLFLKNSWYWKCETFIRAFTVIRTRKKTIQWNQISKHLSVTSNLQMMRYG